MRGVHFKGEGAIGNQTGLLHDADLLLVTCLLLLIEGADVNLWSYQNDETLDLLETIISNKND
jgi:hypothetical protein